MWHVSDRYFITTSFTNSSSQLHQTFIHHNTFTTTLFKYLHHKLQRIILRNIYVIISSTQLHSQTLYHKSLSDRCFDKLFTNIQMSYISYHKHSQSLSDRCFDKLFTNIQMSYISYHKHSQSLSHTSSQHIEWQIIHHFVSTLFKYGE